MRAEPVGSIAGEGRETDWRNSCTAYLQKPTAKLFGDFVHATLLRFGIRRFSDILPKSTYLLWGPKHLEGNSHSILQLLNF